MEWSRALGAAVIELEVRASGDGALTLYRLLGFVEQARRRGYYRNPTEDAVLMAAALQS
jgi:ribosomal-protein-alanine N-acetyltransferase